MHDRQRLKKERTWPTIQTTANKIAYLNQTQPKKDRKRNVSFDEDLIFLKFIKMLNEKNYLEMKVLNFCVRNLQFEKR